MEIYTKEVALNVDELNNLKFVIDQLSDEVFSLVGELEYSIGQQVRHVLSFYKNFIKAEQEQLIISYGDRSSNEKIETSVEYAKKEIESIVASLSKINTSGNVSFQVNASDVLDLPKSYHLSSILYTHSVHHNALIKAILINNSVDFPKNFGVEINTINRQ